MISVGAIIHSARFSRLIQKWWHMSIMDESDESGRYE